DACQHKAGHGHATLALLRQAATFLRQPLVKMIVPALVLFAQFKEIFCRNQVAQRLLLSLETVATAAVEHADGAKHIAIGIQADACPRRRCTRIQLCDHALVDHIDILTRLARLDDDVVLLEVREVHALLEALALLLWQQRKGKLFEYLVCHALLPEPPLTLAPVP